MKFRVTLMLSTLTVGLVSLGAVGVVLSAAEGHQPPGQGTPEGWVQARPDVAAVTHPTYAEECGACHMAYQPGLLPALAWARIMDPAALADHYGDEASLPADTVITIATYLTAHAAEQSDGQRARAFAVGIPGVEGPGGALPRITQSAYFLRKHDEIPARMVTGNLEVGSFSQCNRCHQGAADGVYNEDQIRIPGVGRWED